MSIGTDFENAPPIGPGPHSPDLLQIMPWPVFSKMTDREKRAIHEYLRAIPCQPAGSDAVRTSLFNVLTRVRSRRPER